LPLTLLREPLTIAKLKATAPSPEAPEPNGARVLAMPPRATGEAELARRLCERDPGAAQALYVQYAGLLKRILTQVLGGTRDVDDLVQDTLIIVIERAHALRKAASFRSFVIGVALHLAKNEIRRRTVRRFVGLDDITEVSIVDPLDESKAEVASHLYAALERLETQARMAFVLRFVHGCDLAETAAACGCSLATVKRKLSRAEAKFAILVEADPVLRESLRQAVGTL
jgi:RNA polymerase sigma-70 factor, ECF subfamily